ncbi:MAG: primosomal protein N' [Massiliimalia sp.]
MVKGRLVAKVYVEKAVFHIDKGYDYLIPEQMESTLCRGCRVMVPFGRGNQKCQGMVMEVTLQNEPDPRVKPVLLQLDAKPIFSEEMFGMAEFLVNRTFCTFYDAVKTILPNAFGMRFTEQYQLGRKFTQEELEEDFSYEERNLLGFLRTAKTKKQLDDFLSQQTSGSYEKTVQGLLQKGAIQKIDLAKQKVSEQTVTMMRLTDLFFSEEFSGKLTPKQKEVTEFLAGVQSAAKKEVMYFCAVGESVLKALVKKGIAEFYEQEVFRVPEEENTPLSKPDPIVLSGEQEQVYSGLSSLLEQNQAKVALLHGVTGSGKTSVYLKLIERTLDLGKQALMMVPEISLTPQIVKQFKNRFGNQVAVMHSSLSLGERMDEYKRIQQGKANIVVGTRSAVFMPLSRIGLIIMDEEGEASYKSDAPPRYHAREVAKYRCFNHQALLLLGSATPSVESYYQAKTGVYQLFEMKQRYAQAVLPEVYLVDMRDEEKRGNLSSVSVLLQQEVNRNLQQGEQTILFINRRGYQTFASCLSCGEVVKCPRCDVALTYHKDNGYMMCHYCGYAHKFQKKCPSCGSEHLKLSGLGTQKIEDELEALFPGAKILRMDTDTTYSRYAYSEKFEAFRQGKYDILVGTQMIAKGLDFPNVTLVGVLSADTGLYSNDFRGIERVFSLVTQVVGRSGRADKMGRAYLQTYQPDHPVLNFAARQDYESFYQDEIISRKALLYPPFCDICTISFSGIREALVENSARVFLGMMKQAAEGKENTVPMRVLGPVKPPIYRMNGKYRLKIYIKCRYNTAFRSYLRGLLRQAPREKSFRGITLTADMNGDMNH